MYGIEYKVSGVWCDSGVAYRSRYEAERVAAHWEGIGYVCRVVGQSDEADWEREGF